MYEFYKKHVSPFFWEHIDLGDFQSIRFWKEAIENIPPLIRKLAEYYQIPPSKYPKVVITFSDERWEEWKTLYGKRHILGRIVGGTYFLESNMIELNPYLYLFQGGQQFLATVYHELSHWIIEQVDYLKEELFDKKGKMEYHLFDFDMVMGDIFDVSTINDKWSNYRNLKAQRTTSGEHVYKDIQTLKNIVVCKADKNSEYYKGRYRLVKDNGCYYKFWVDNYIN